MVSFFRKFLGGTPRTAPFDHQAQARQALESLPPCTQYVVIASSKYSGKYRCEVTVAAADIAPFMKNVAASTFGGSKQSQVARTALPVWLANASFNDGKTSYLPRMFADELDFYVLNFIKEGIATVFCNDCGLSIDEVQTSIRNRQVTGSWSEWTDSWKCQAGHVLYTEDQEMHILRRREP